MSLYIPADYAAPEDVASACGRGVDVHIRFCRDCPLFEENYWQPNPSLYKIGWCRRMSYYQTLDSEDPYYVYVNSDSFCNEDQIRNEDDY